MEFIFIRNRRLLFDEFKIFTHSVLQVITYAQYFTRIIFLMANFRVAGVNTSSDSDGYILKCHYLNGLCYARYDSDPLAPLKVLFTKQANK